MFRKLFSSLKGGNTPVLPPATWRQGDVFLVETTAWPEGLRIRPPILAEGEVTGHAHRLSSGTTAQVLGDANGRLFLEVTGTEASVVHEEHGPVTVPRGRYEVRIQREYHPTEIRRVLD